MSKEDSVDHQADCDWLDIKLDPPIDVPFSVNRRIMCFTVAYELAGLRSLLEHSLHAR
jgi:hypothetical protein